MGDGVIGWSKGSDGEIKGRLLAELATRTGAEPHRTLGVSATASAAEVRAAFLRETKALHPNRFARRPHEVRTLANELFLAVSEAYKELSEGPKTPAHDGSFVIADGEAPPEEFDDIASSVRTRVSFKKKGGKGQGGAKADGDRSSKTNGRRRRTSTQRRKLATRRGRGSDPAAATKRKSEPPMSPTAAEKAPAPAAKSAPPPATAKSLADVTEKMAALDSARLTKFRQAIRLLKKEHYRAAKDAFRELAIEVPSERKYRVYMNHAEGMHQQALGNDDEAEVSFERALSLDPRFSAASEALDSLSSRGVLSRFFRK